MDSRGNDSGIGALVGGIILVEFLVILAMVAFMVWMFWRIFAKTGMNGALGLIALVPGFGSLVALIILSFGRWPIEDQVAALAAGQPMPAANPNPFAGPPATQ